MKTITPRWLLSLSHCLEMWLVWTPVMLITQSTIAAGAATVAWYWSRKKLEVEMWNGHDADPTSSWTFGWFPWQWGDRYMVLDVVGPAILAVIVIALSTAASAQPQGALCMPLDSMMAQLAAKYDETITAVGTATNGVAAISLLMPTAGIDG